MDNMDIYKEVVCPICGHKTYNNFWICDHCNWEYDGTTEGYSAANDAYLEEYKDDYLKSIKD